MKKIDGLTKLETKQFLGSDHKRTSYDYKGVVIVRSYSQGTVGRVGLKRGRVGYKTAGYRNSFYVETWNEARGVSDYHIFTPRTLQDAINMIDNMLNEQNGVVIKGKIYRNFPQEVLEKK